MSPKNKRNSISAHYVLSHPLKELYWLELVDALERSGSITGITTQMKNLFCNLCLVVYGLPNDILMGVFLLQINLAISR